MMIQEGKKKFVQQKALDTALRLCQSLPGFERVEANITSSVLILHLSFPSLVRERSAALIGEIEEQTGWIARIHHPSLEEHLRRSVLHLLKGAGLSEYVHLRYNLKRCIVCVCGADPQTSILVRNVQDTFNQSTGWTLMWREDYEEEKSRRKAGRAETHSHAQLLSLLESSLPGNCILEATAFHPNQRVISVRYSGSIPSVERAALIRLFFNAACGWGLDLLEVSPENRGKTTQVMRSEALNIVSPEVIVGGACPANMIPSGRMLLPIPHSIYFIPIERLKLSRRLCLALQCYHISLVGELLELSEDDLNCLQYQMKNSMKVIYECLQSLGAFQHSSI